MERCALVDGAPETNCLPLPISKGFGRGAFAREARLRVVGMGSWSGEIQAVNPGLVVVPARHRSHVEELVDGKFQVVEVTSAIPKRFYRSAGVSSRQALTAVSRSLDDDYRRRYCHAMYLLLETTGLTDAQSSCPNMLLITLDLVPYSLVDTFLGPFQG